MIKVTQSEAGDGRSIISIGGAIDRSTVPEVYHETLRKVEVKGAGTITIDLSGAERLDSAGTAFLGLIATRGKAAGNSMALQGVSPHIERTLKLFRMPSEEEMAALEPPKGPRKSLAERAGNTASSYWNGLMAFLMLTADCFVWTFGGARRTKKVRKGAVWVEGNRIGVDSLPIVGLIAFLIGVVLALQSAYQLRQFGADIFVANLIAVSMTREMGPLMTAIIIAGRSGAAIAAEVATMSVNDEVSALKTIGLEPVRYIVVPKFQALSLAMPALTVFANLLGIIGGFIVALLYMKMGPGTFFGQVLDALVLKDLVTGLVKSVAFAWLIVLIAAHNGFQAYGGAESVGLSTTQSVVRSIFWVIVFDAMFNILFYFG